MVVVEPKSTGVVTPPSLFVVALEMVITPEPILVTVVPEETKFPRISCPRTIEVVVIPIVVAAPVAIDHHRLPAIDERGC